MSAYEFNVGNGHHEHKLLCTQLGAKCFVFNFTTNFPSWGGGGEIINFIMPSELWEIKGHSRLDYKGYTLCTK